MEKVVNIKILRICLFILLVTNGLYVSGQISVTTISGNTNEGGGTATFDIVLDSEPTADVTIDISSDDTDEGTVLPVSITFTSGDWDTPQTVTVTGVDDAVVDGDVTYNIVTAAASSTDLNYDGLDAADVSVTNEDNDVAGISLTAISGNTNEAGGTATFDIVLDSEPTADVTIGISSDDTDEGTVLPVSITFTSGDWDTPQTVTVTGVDDAVVDGDVTYNIVTAAASSTDLNYDGLDAADVSVTNEDNDVAGISLTAISGNTNEGGGTATFDIVLDSEPTAEVTIDISSDDTDEGTVLPVSITFTSGDWDTPQTVTVTGVDDAVVDGDVTYNIVTAAASSTDLNYDGFDAADVSVTNEDNDVAGISLTAISGNTNEGGGTATFDIVLDSEPTDEVTIGISSDDTEEGTVLPVSITFTSGDWDTPQTVTVTGVDDAVVDGDVAYNIVTAAASSTDLNYDGLDAADVSVTNEDNDVAGISLTAISGNTTEAGGTATFDIVLDSEPTAEVTIDISSDDTDEGTVLPVSITFTSGDWDTPQTVTVTGVDDAVVDGDVTYNIVTAAASSTDLNYDGLDAADVSVTNEDNDVAGISLTAISGNTTEAGGTATFTIVLDSEPTAEVTIGISSDDTEEGTVLPVSITFTSGDWDTPQTVTVTGVDDAVVDGDVTYNIVTAAASSTDLNYDGFDAADVSVTNEDNDVAGISLTAISGNTTEAGGTATFTIVLDSEPTADVTIDISSDDTEEGTVLPVSITFTSGDWDTPQTVTVTGVDDAVVDGDVTYNIVTAAASSTDLNYDGLDAADVSVTNEDNDVAGISLTAISGNTNEGGGTATFDIVLDSEPTADVTIGISSDDTDEGTVLPVSITFTSGDWDTPQTVTVTGVDDAVVDGDVTYNIVTAAASSTDLNYDGLDAADVSVTNEDNDVAGISLTAISGNTNEGGGTATFDIVLDSEPTAEVTIDISSDDTDEGTVLPVSITFTSGDWDTPQTVTVTGVDDAVVDGDVTYNIVTAAASSTDLNYDGLDAADVSVTNEDNDAATLSIDDLIVSEGDGTATFTITLTGEVPGGFDVDYSTSDGTATAGNDYTAISAATLSFTGTDGEIKTFSVVIINDDVPESNETFTVTLSNISGTAGDISFNDDTGQGTITDNDNAPVISTCATDKTLSADANCQSAVPDLTAEIEATDDGTFTISQSPTAATLIDLGTTEVTISVTDEDNNTSTCTVNIEVIDDSAPVINSTHSAQTVNLDASCEALMPDYTGDVNATDNCDAALDITQSPLPGTLITGTTTVLVTLTVTDDASNEASTSFDLTILDVTAPIPDVTDLPDLTDECSITATAPTATDACAGIITATTSDPLVYGTEGTYTITWNYDDGNGNTETQIQNVIIDDNTPPTITAPNDLIVSADIDLCTATGVDLGSPETDDNCGVESVTNDAEEPYDLGTNTITWTVTDNSGNISTATQIVTVIDDQDPVITTCATDKTQVADQNGESIMPDLLSEIVASDNCDTDLTITQDPVVGATIGIGITTVTITAEDDAGNTASCFVDVRVTDEESPFISNCAEDKLQDADNNCQSIVPDLTTEVVATDNGIIASITQSPAAGTNISTGVTVVTITVTDNEGNSATCTATVTVIDVTDPVPDVADLPDITGECSVTAIAPTATDACSGSITATTTDPLTYDTEGTFLITWTYEDGNGNEISQTQNVIIDDITDPVPDVAILPDLTGECSVTVGASPSATDACEGAIIATTTDPLTYEEQGSYIITWTYDDGNGNSVDQIQNVIIEDITDPTIVSPADLVISNDPGYCYSTGIDLGLPEVNDNCEVSSVTNDAVEPYTSGENIVTWTVTDVAGNTATATQVVTVEDDEAPVILTCAEDRNLFVDGNNQATIPDFTSEISSIDNCDNDLTISQLPLPGTLIDTGKTVIEIRVTDDTGNYDSCEVTINAIQELPAEWNFSPSGYLYSGQVSAKVIIDGTEVKYGMLGAFAGNECRGVVEASYFAPSDHYVFDLIVFSNAPSSEYIIFKYFDYYTGDLYDLVDSIEFIPDMIINNALVPYEMNYFSYSQNSFVQGWNWFSVNLKPADNSLSSIFEGPFSEGDYIKSQTQSAIYYEGSGWFGQLNSIDAGILYKAKFTNAGVENIEGYSIDLQNTPISLVSGWNWIGFLPSQAMSVEDAMSSVTLTNLDYIKSQFNSTVYYEGYGWFGGLEELIPGQGYMIKLANPDELIFPEVSAKKSLANKDLFETDKYVDRTQYEFSGNMTAKVVLDNFIAGSEHDTIFAYAGNECRGYSPAMYFSPLNEFVFQLLISSNAEEGEEIHFKYYSSKLNTTFLLSEKVEFTSDMFLANAFNAFEFNLNSVLGDNNVTIIKEKQLIRLYPVPFRNNLNIDLQIYKPSSVYIEVFDITGKSIDVIYDANLEAGIHHLGWEAAGIKSGTYFIRTILNDRTILRKVTLID